MRKSSLSKRIKAAVKAFKEGPAPELIPLAPPPSIITRPSIRTIKAYVSGWYPERTLAERAVAREIGVELLKAGCIQFTVDEREMALFGRVCVLAPEEG